MLLMGLMTFTNQRRRVLAEKELKEREQYNDQDDQRTAAEADKAEGIAGEAANLDRLTDEQYEEVMKNGDNVKAELTRLKVEFDKKAKVDELRELLNEALATRGLMP